MTDEHYMQRAVELARRGGGATRSNPNVGAVIVHRGRIIGEGYHRTYGGPHAEVEAIRQVQAPDQALLADSTMYITLEPCNHHGKTPPCVDLLIKHRLKRIVIGTLDPSPKMSGKSVTMLRERGHTVEVGVLASTCREVLHPFTIHQQGRPYITIKQAVSADNYIGISGQQVWLSSVMSTTIAHQWRSTSDAILIGTNTALVDDPSLTTRRVQGRNPLRVILDRQGRLPQDIQVFTDDGATLILTEATSYPGGVDFVTVKPWSLSAILSVLWERGIRYLLVEGGAQIVRSFYEEGLWDEALHIQTPVELSKGIPAVDITGRLLKTYKAGQDVLYLIGNR